MTRTQFKKLRLQLGLTQREMARQMGYFGPMTISLKERGERGITRTDVMIIQSKWRGAYKKICKK